MHSCKFPSPSPLPPPPILLPLLYCSSVTLEMPQGSFTLEPAMVSVNRTQKTVHGGCAVLSSKYPLILEYTSLSVILVELVCIADYCVYCVLAYKPSLAGVYAPSHHPQLCSEGSGSVCLLFCGNCFGQRALLLSSEHLETKEGTRML